MKSLKHTSLYLLLFVSCLAPSGCKTSDTQTSESKVAESQSGSVGIQCLVPQGNGGNWGSTLGWMSEQLTQRAVSEKIRGQVTSFHLGCMAGGSSGSAATALYMTLLNNQNLFPGKNSNGLYSIEEMELLGRALRFIALSIDYDLDQSLRFWSELIASKAKDVALPSTSATPSMTSPSWWEKELINPDTLLTDASSTFLIAKHLTRSDIDSTINTGGFSEENTKFLNERNILKLSDLSEYEGISSIPDESTSESKLLHLLLKLRSITTTQITKARLRTTIPAHEYSDRYKIGVSKDSPDSSHKSILESPMANGFCTVAMASILTEVSDSDLSVAPDYSTMRTVVFCNKETIETIISNKEYQNHVQSGHKYASRFLFAVTPNIRGAVGPSVREPGLMAELLDSHIGNYLTTDYVYDPKVDSSFKLTKISEKYPSENNRRGYFFAIGGGFVARKIAAWPLSYYQEALEQRYYGQLGASYISIFGKPDSKVDEDFGENVIRTVFSSSESLGKVNVADWHAFQQSWCQTFSSKLSSGERVANSVLMNWDVTKIPAVQAGSSYVLVAKSINATRLQFAKNAVSKEIGVVFDPFKSKIPVPESSTTCP